MTRVLVTGAAGGFGSSLLGRLAARGGVDVVAFDVRSPRALPVGVEHVAGDVRDASAVERAMRGCDVVVHLAWVVGSMRDARKREEIDLGGTANVLAAMQQVGCPRLVFASSVTAYGSVAEHPQPYTEDDPLIVDQPSTYASHKARAEVLVAESGVEAVLPRAAMVVGRQVDNAVRTVFAAPVLAAVRGDHPQVQAVHPDDVGRFYVEACLGSRTGPVNLAAPDVLPIEEAARLLGKRLVRLPEPVVQGFVRATWALRAGAIDPGEFNSMRYLPLADVTHLREGWGFEPEHSTADALAEFGRALTGVIGIGRWTLRRPGGVVARTWQGLSSARKQ
jgi:nucleoside-diphosphate-sugar epimerase